MIFIIFSYPGNTGNLIFLISHILEILENGFSSFSHILEILEIEVCNILHNLEIRAAGGRAEAGGRLQGLCCAALDYFWDPVPGLGICRDVFTTCVLLFSHILEILEI